MMQGAGAAFPVPPEGFAIITAQFGSFVAGASVASALLAAGDMTWQQIVLTLLVGNVLTSVTRSIRWLGSSYVAIFGMRTGTEIMLVSTALRNGIMVLLVAVLAYGFGWGWGGWRCGWRSWVERRDVSAGCFALLVLSKKGL
ncbi:MAG TPA: hypothetical protein PLG75_02765 [Methanoculleus sp.]|nr:hypothetical protein [Methanoculleus sp.]